MTVVVESCNSVMYISHITVLHVSCKSCLVARPPTVPTLVPSLLPVTCLQLPSPAYRCLQAVPLRQAYL